MGFLVVAAGIKRHSWFLLGVGALGMLHNVLVAGVTRKPDAHGIPLEHLHGETIGKKSPGGTKRRKAMDVLAEAEKKIAGLGVALRPVFFSDIMLQLKERYGRMLERDFKRASTKRRQIEMQQRKILANKRPLYEPRTALRLPYRDLNTETSSSYNLGATGSSIFKRC
jgi:hypothetical protein